MGNLNQKNKIGILILLTFIIITLREIFVFIGITQSMPIVDYLFLVTGVVIAIITIIMAYNYRKETSKK